MSAATQPSGSSFTVIGGYARSLVNFRKPLLLALQEAGFTVHTMAGSPDQQTVATLCDLNVPFVAIPLDRTSLNPLADIRATVAMWRQLRLDKPSAVLAYTIKPVIFGLLAARLAGVRNRYALITGLGFGLTGTTWRRRAFSWTLRRMYQLALSRATLVFFQNPDDEHVFRSSILSDKTQTVIVRGSGVDTTHFAFSPPPPTCPFRFLFIGRFTVEKGLRDLMEATRILRSDTRLNFEVHTVGWVDSNPAGLTDAEVRSWVDEGLIVHHGGSEDVRPHISACHALVLPSYREGTPRSVLEAMAMGRAVITTDAPGCRETTVHEETGLLVPVNDAHNLSEAMRRLIDNPDLAAAFGEAGRARVVSLYEAGAVAHEMVRAAQKTVKSV